MTRKATLLTLGGAGALVYFILTFLLADVFPVTGLKLWLVRILLWVFGIAAASWGFWFFSKRSPKARRAETAFDLGADVAHTLAAAKGRLKQSGFKGGLGQLPMVLFMGPTGCGKTSAVAHSGIEPFLLAGDNQSDDEKPTNGINIWFDQESQSTLVEVGGAFGDDDRKWSKLTHRLRPNNLLAILGRQPQAPRAAVLCVSCEELLQSDDGRRSQLAKDLRSRLGDLSKELGVMLPFYVLFTKTDVIPHFDAYVERLQPGEIDEVFGASLPFDFETHTSSYTDRLSRRIDSEYKKLVISLANKRLQLFEREADVDVKGRAYEFPRELLREKFVKDLKQFLTALGKPTDLTINPLLRGFYFTGRRITVAKGAPDAEPRRVIQSPGAASATSAFGAPVVPVHEAAPPSPASTQTATQTLFLRRWFRHVIFSDAMAKQVTGAGAGINFNRRALLAIASAVPLIFTMCVTRSYLGNSELRAEVTTSMRGLRPIRTEPGRLPTLESMQNLERMWGHLEELTEHKKSRPPLRLRWGLYSGSRIEPDVRRIYATAYDTLMLQPVLTKLERELRDVTPDGTSPALFSRVRNSLKSYLMLTEQRSRIDHDFLDTALVNRWFSESGTTGNRGPTETLAQNQFGRFGSTLCEEVGLTCPIGADQAVVQRACTYLTAVSSADQVYESTISNARFDSIRLSDQFDNRAASHVSADHVVPGAFTAEAWTEIRRRLQNADNLGDDQWMCGDIGGMPTPGRFAEENLTRYFDQYRAHWLEFLRDVRVAEFGRNDVVSRLEVLSANDSPLLEVLALVARNTAVDDVEIAPMFQPVHQVTPPGESSIVNDNNRLYLDELVKVKSAIELLTQGVPAGEGVADARSKAQAALDQVNSMARDFEGGIASDVSNSVQSLLRAPITHAQARLGTFQTSGLNGPIDTFCQDYNVVAGFYPFTATGGNAPIDRVTRMFQRPSGALWQFYNGTLQEHLAPTSDGYGPRSGSQLSNRFVQFFNSAANISESLFPGDNQRLSLNFAIRGETTTQIPEISFVVDNETVRSTRQAPGFVTVFWVADAANEASVTAWINGRPVTVASATGPWAVFRVFGETRSFTRSQGYYEAVWDVPGGAGRTVTATIDFFGQGPFLEPGYLTSRRCGR